MNTYNIIIRRGKLFNQPHTLFNPLFPERRGCVFKCMTFKHNLGIDILRVNIGSGNGLMSSGNVLMLFPEPVLAKNSDARWHIWAKMSQWLEKYEMI